MSSDIRRQTPYEEALAAILKGAAELRRACTKQDYGPAQAIFCLKLAHRIWCDTVRDADVPYAALGKLIDPFLDMDLSEIKLPGTPDEAHKGVPGPFHIGPGQPCAPAAGQEGLTPGEGEPPPAGKRVKYPGPGTTGR